MIKNIFALFVFMFVISCELIIDNQDDQAGATSETTNGIAIVITGNDSSSASGALVKVRSADFVKEPTQILLEKSQQAPEAETAFSLDTALDKEGKLVIPDVPQGRYIVEVLKDGQSGTIKMIDVKNSNKLYMFKDTLRALGGVKGNFDNFPMGKTLYLQVIGLDKLTKVDPQTGNFEIFELPRFNYSIKVFDPSNPELDLIHDDIIVNEGLFTHIYLNVVIPESSDSNNSELSSSAEEFSSSSDDVDTELEFSDVLINSDDIIKNGSFKTKHEGWAYHNTADVQSEGVLIYENEELHFSLVKEGENHNEIGLKQDIFLFKPAKVYYLTFTARADLAKEISWQINFPDESKEPLIYDVVQLSESYQTYSFVVGEFSDINSQMALIFGLAKGEGDVYFDKISLYELDGSFSELYGTEAPFDMANASSNNLSIQPAGTNWSITKIDTNAAGVLNAGALNTATTYSVVTIIAKSDVTATMTVQYGLGDLFETYNMVLTEEFQTFDLVFGGIVSQNSANELVLSLLDANPTVEIQNILIKNVEL